MATTKANAVQPETPTEYIVFDSHVPEISCGDNLLSRSLPKISANLLRTAVNDIKGANFSQCRTRIWYCPSGYDNNPHDTLKLGFEAVYRPGMGKVTEELVSLARLRESAPPNADMG